MRHGPIHTASGTAAHNERAQCNMARRGAMQTKNSTLSSSGRRLEPKWLRSGGIIKQTTGTQPLKLDGSPTKNIGETKENTRKRQLGRDYIKKLKYQFEFWPVLDSFPTKLGPKTPLNGSGSKNNAERTYNQPNILILLQFRDIFSSTIKTKI